MNKNSLFRMQDLSVGETLSIIKTAIDFDTIYKDYRLPKANLQAANLFFESSTRTHYSFKYAQTSLGMVVSDLNVAASSVTKDESLYDTCKTFESIGYDLLVIRHQEDEYFNLLKNIQIPIINAGDGKGSHPTQCLLDLMTIYQEFGSFENLNVLIVGDIAHSRVASSNKYALEVLKANVKCSCMNEWERDGFGNVSFDEAISWADVVMMLRVQKERGALMQMSDSEYLEKYGLNKKRYERMKSHAILMHPAPVNRGIEIADELVESDKSRIFKQMHNGMLIRKACIKRAFDIKGW